MGSTDLTLSLCFPARDGWSAEDPGPRRVPCSSWCCESGRRQSENGYFTTPGWHRTTLRPPAGEERRFPRTDGHTARGSTASLPLPPAQTCKGNQVLNSYLGTSLPRQSEIEVRPLNISAGLAPRRPASLRGAGQSCRSFWQWVVGSCGVSTAPACSTCSPADTSWRVVL